MDRIGRPSHRQVLLARSKRDTSNRSSDAGDIPPDEQRILAGLLLTLLYPLFVFGGSRPTTQWAVLVLACGTLLLALLRRSRQPPLLTILKDPVFWLGGGFLVLLLTQWLNAGRTALFNWATMSWMYTPPAIAWLPGAVTRDDGLEALRWFIPAGVIMLVIRNTLSRRAIRLLYGILTAGSALLALQALVQWGAAAAKCCGVLYPADSYFATSFGYMNHAGAYCVLALTLSFSLLFRSLRKEGPGKRWQRIVFGMASLLLFAGAHASESRAAICLAWLVTLFAALLFVSRNWRTLSPSDRLNRVVIVGGVLCLLVFFIDGFGHDMLKREFVTQLTAHTPSAITSSSQFISAIAKEGAGGDRNFFRETALKVWKDHLWLGAGLWAQRYFMGIYLDPSEWGRVLDEGAANVHTDGLQFLSEFGLVGVLLMGLTVLVAAWPIMSATKGLYRTPERLILLTGLVALVAYSFVDLPFRSPAIMLVWTALVSGEAAYWHEKRRPSPQSA